MKRILFLLLLVCAVSSAQVHKLEAIGLDTLTTAERDAITVPGDRAYIIYNETTGQFEYSAKGGAWQVLGGGGGGLTDMNWSDPVDANVLPDADGTRDLGSSAFSFQNGWFDGVLTVGGGEVTTAASAFGTDNALIRSDGTGKGVQSSGITIDDSDNMTIDGVLYPAAITFQPAGSSFINWAGANATFGGGDAPSGNFTRIGYNLTTDTQSSIIFQMSDGVSLVDRYLTATTTDITYNGTSLLGGGGSGDVVGPASATDNAIARFDATTGKLLQNSGVTINDSGTITTSGAVNAASVVMTNGAKTSDANGLFVLQSNDASNEMEMQINRLATNFNHFQINAIEQGVAFRPIVLNRSGGNVGINTGATTPPSEALDVNGNIAVSGTVDGVDISALTGTDVALADAGAYFTTDNVEAATQELAADVAGKVDGTISDRTSVTPVTAIGTQTVANYLSDGVPSPGEWVGLSDATPEYLTTSATFNFALLDEYNYDDSATDAATITFSNMGEGHKVRIKYNRASAPAYSGETPTQLPNTFSAGSWPANDDVEAVYYKRFGTVYYFFKEL